MANIRFLWSNRYVAATTVLTASSSVAALPVTNTQNDDRSKVWRSVTGTGTPTIDIDQGSSQNCTAIALANAKVVGSGVIEFYRRGSAGSPGSATLVATLAAQDLQTRAVAAFFSNITDRHLQLKWTNPGSVSDYAALGYAFVGTYTEPTVNVRVPFPQSLQDPSQMSSSVDGQKSFATRTKFMQGTFAFDAVLKAQLEQLQTMFSTIGCATPVFVTLDTAISWMTWMLRVGALSWDTEPGGAIGRFGPVLPWEEAR